MEEYLEADYGPGQSITDFITLQVCLTSPKGYSPLTDKKNTVGVPLTGSLFICGFCDFLGDFIIENV